MPFLLRTAVTAIALFAADYLIDGISFRALGLGLGDLDLAVTIFINAIALGLLNALVKPILVLLSLPVTCLTLGLFILVINGVMLVLLGVLPLGFVVSDLPSAIVAGVVVSLVSFVLHRFIPG